MQSTDDELHCIRYSLLVPALAAAYVVARGALSLHALDVHMYFTKLTQDMGVLEQTRKLSCMAYPFHLPMNHASTRARWWLFDLQIAIGRNEEAEAQSQAGCTEYNAVRRRSIALSIFGVST